MKPLISVIIPVYCHKEEAVACLRSLAKQTYPSLEIVVVDDASRDGLAEYLAKEKNLPTHRLITLSENGGAPAARNRGLAESRGEYVIFLDADVELVPQALERWWMALEENPQASFAYSRFIFGGKRFTSEPFDPDRLKEVNYIHTSALIRRADALLFDPALKKFQDWDLWIRFARAGKRGIFVPEVLFSVSAKQHPGQMSHWLPAFFYTIPWWVFGWAPKEMEASDRARRVLEEKHAGWITIHERPSQEMRETARRVRFVVLGILSIECLSFFVTFVPVLNTGLALALAIFLGYWAFRSPTSALTILLVELLIGGKGGLFKVFADTSNNGGVNVRLLLFGAWIVGTAGSFLQKRFRWREIFGRLCADRFRMGALIGVGAPLVWGVLRGFSLNQPFLLVDANAWGFWLLLPFLLLLPDLHEAVRTWIRPAIIAALFWLCLKTAAIFSLFAFFGRTNALSWVYLWVRRTGVGEITLVDGVWPRVFFQSHIYLIPALVALFTWLWFKPDQLLKSLRRFVLGAASVVFAMLLVTLSRSLWIGAFAGIGALLLWLFWRRAVPRQQIMKEGAVIILGALALVVVLSASPRIWFAGSGFNALKNRVDVSEEAAAVSRWQMLPPLKEAIMRHPWLGSGFGATVTYRSEDPRIVEKTGGLYTTYAFEWGWLDLWYKLGAFGLALFLGWYAWLFAKLWQGRNEMMGVMLFFSLLSLGVVHLFTPYVNHPLGIGLLLLGWVYVALLSPEKREPRIVVCDKVD